MGDQQPVESLKPRFFFQIPSYFNKGMYVPVMTRADSLEKAVSNVEKWLEHKLPPETEVRDCDWKKLALPKQSEYAVDADTDLEIPEDSSALTVKAPDWPAELTLEAEKKNNLLPVKIITPDTTAEPKEWSDAWQGILGD